MGLLADRQAKATRELRTRNAPGDILALQAAGIDTREIPGLFEALSGGGQAVRQGLLANPQAPLQQGIQRQQQALQQQEQQVAGQQQQQAAATFEGQLLQNAKAQQELEQRQTTFHRSENQRLMPFLTAGRDLGVVQDMGTILRTVGTETFPTAAKGSFNALRFRVIDAIRRTTEAGALQAAEIEFFESLVPEGDALFNLTPAERFARLNELERWWRGKLEDQLLLDDSGLTVEDFDRFGRTFDEITTSPFPVDTVPGVGEDTREQLPAPPAGFPQPGESIF